MLNSRLRPGDRYYGLDAPREFWYDLKNNPDKVKKCCNGVGSQVGFWGRLTYHLIPNTIWGLNVTEASDIHDYMYCYPDHFITVADAINHKHKADNGILTNILEIIDRDSIKLLKIPRRNRAMSYYNAVDLAGDDSFLEGKKIGG